ncbi:hypothetical protein SVEN_3299 [Streptomyces venezuelae ATCC 10712]|uniref:Uncharacterized protein n=1 Tax=Streptomyces venezuelae (strain ATCC 10712 / CBS 650.69 / DSM 40230 / JCM 4526 / NBRC 13096 / PD 04745) TaxID=953739 RepID=F2RAA3_STRVP|nr:hypothetical protein SVEN_3299 [Streptomyces venezuelae ATCC 10712]
MRCLRGSPRRERTSSRQGGQAEGDGAGFGRETLHDFPRVGGVGSGGEVLDCRPVLSDQLESMLGPADGVLPVCEELIGSLVPAGGDDRWPRP